MRREINRGEFAERCYLPQNGQSRTLYPYGRGASIVRRGAVFVELMLVKCKQFVKYLTFLHCVARKKMGKMAVLGAAEG